MTGGGSEWRRFWARANQVANETGVSLQVAARTVCESDRRLRAAEHASPADVPAVDARTEAAS